MDFGVFALYLCINHIKAARQYGETVRQSKRMKKQYSLFIHSAFFDIMLPQKVRQVGLSETHDALLRFPHAFAIEPQRLLDTHTGVNRE